MALINNISRVHVATLMCLYNKNKKFYCYQITNTNINHLCSLQNYGFEGRKQSDVCENGSFSIFPRDFFFKTSRKYSVLSKISWEIFFF